MARLEAATTSSSPRAHRGVMVYDVTDPVAPRFVQSINERDFAAPPSSPNSRDHVAEGVVVIESSANARRCSGLDEVSGTLRVFGSTRRTEDLKTRSHRKDSNGSHVVKLQEHNTDNQNLLVSSAWSSAPRSTSSGVPHHVRQHRPRGHQHDMDKVTLDDYLFSRPQADPRAELSASHCFWPAPPASAGRSNSRTADSAPRRPRPELGTPAERTFAGPTQVAGFSFRLLVPPIVPSPEVVQHQDTALWTQTLGFRSLPPGDPPPRRRSTPITLSRPL